VDKRLALDALATTLTRRVDNHPRTGGRHSGLHALLPTRHNIPSAAAHTVNDWTLRRRRGNLSLNDSPAPPPREAACLHLGLLWVLVQLRATFARDTFFGLHVSFLTLPCTLRLFLPHTTRYARMHRMARTPLAHVHTPPPHAAAAAHIRLPTPAPRTLHTAYAHRCSRAHAALAVPALLRTPGTARAPACAAPTCTTTCHLCAARAPACCHACVRALATALPPPPPHTPLAALCLPHSPATLSRHTSPHACRACAPGRHATCGTLPPAHLTTAPNPPPAPHLPPTPPRHCVATSTDGLATLDMLPGTGKDALRTPVGGRPWARCGVFRRGWRDGGASARAGRETRGQRDARLCASHAHCLPYAAPRAIRRLGLTLKRLCRCLACLRCRDAAPHAAPGLSASAPRLVACLADHHIHYPPDMTSCRGTTTWTPGQTGRGFPRLPPHYLILTHSHLRCLHSAISPRT